jgi:hypothetical protein
VQVGASVALMPVEANWRRLVTALHNRGPRQWRTP